MGKGAFMRHFPLPFGKWLRASLLAVSFLIWTGCFAAKPATDGGAYQPMEGDVVFQSLPADSDLVEAIEGITESPFSHCGVVRRIDDQWMVIEAIGEVRRTELSAWIARGRGGHLAAYRLREPFRRHIPAMNAAMERFLGRPYDFRYRLEDDHLYCSELVFRGYQIATEGEALGVLRKLGDMNWEPHRAVIQKYEGCAPDDLPLDRLMITPKDLANAPELECVFNFGFMASQIKP